MNVVMTWTAARLNGLCEYDELEELDEVWMKGRFCLFILLLLSVEYFCVLACVCVLRWNAVFLFMACLCTCLFMFEVFFFFGWYCDLLLLLSFLLPSSRPQTNLFSSKRKDFIPDQLQSTKAWHFCSEEVKRVLEMMNGNLIGQDGLAAEVRKVRRRGIPEWMIRLLNTAFKKRSHWKTGSKWL